MKLDFLQGGGAGPAGMPRFDLFREPPTRALDDASHVVKVGIAAALFFFGALALFALLVPISGAAVATGEVTAAGGPVVIQPASGGIVRRVLVREGQYVRAGQPLVDLDGLRAGAALQQAQAKRDALRALQARLVAERDGAEAIAFPADLATRQGDPAVGAAMAAQRAIFERRREVLGAERDVAETQETAAAAEEEGARKQLALINDELRGIRALYAKGYARKTQLRALERAAADLQAQLGAGGATVARTRLEQAKLAAAQMMEVVAELDRVDQQLAQIGPSLRVARDDAARAVLRSPVAGRVSGLARVGQGSVIGGGTTLMEVVPASRALVVEAKVRPEDVDDITEGAEATLRFTTVNPRGQSSAEGRVVTLSPSRIRDPRGGDYFRAQIAVDDPAALARDGVRLQPGLPVAVNVTTEARTLFDYLLTPIGDAMSTGFREE